MQSIVLRCLVYHQSRHVPINFNATDTWHNRPEAWYILFGTCESGSDGAIGMVGPDYPWPNPANTKASPPYPATGTLKAPFYRDHVAKRPVNIKNMRLMTGSTILGNYRRSYEILNGVGGYSNPRKFIDKQPVMSPVVTSGEMHRTDVTNTMFDVRRLDDMHFEFVTDYSLSYLTGATNKSIITNRFSAPGGIETGKRYSDFRKGAMTTEEKFEAMKKVRDDVVGLTESPLYDFRMKEGNFPVIGDGTHDASIMFIGEAPGKNEAATGKPFCGASGKMLDWLLESIDLPREKVYITNILKDRPPENRDPRPEEIELYVPFLDRQIEIIQPKVLATLGRFAMQYIMKRYGLDVDIEPISKIHGKVFDAGSVQIIPLYHPAVAIYDASRKDELQKDFEVLQQCI